jgi:hypothetical protein
MIRSQLIDGELHCLQAAFPSTADCRLRDRIQSSSWPTGVSPTERSPSTSASVAAPFPEGSTPTQNAGSAAYSPASRTAHIDPVPYQPLQSRLQAHLGSSPLCTRSWRTSKAI